MKIEKVEDLRKLRWRTLTDKEWAIVGKESGFIYDYVEKEKVEELFEDKYREVARKSFLPLEETVTLLRKENYAFHKSLERSERTTTIDIKDVGILMSLLKIPEIPDEQTVLQQFEQLTENEKAHFVAEIWKDYIAPELSELVRN